jgi:hypothetical protein
LTGLARLKKDNASEALFRAAWANPKEAYGARKAALRGLVAVRVDDADSLLKGALKITVDNYSIAATALQLVLEKPAAGAREMAAIYSRYGQPARLRSTAVGAFARLAKDDPALQDLLVDLVDDRDRMVRFQAWTSVRELGVKKALPRMQARLADESRGFSGFTRRALQEAISALKEPQQKPESDNPALASEAQSIAELEGQASDLERKTSELRSRIAALKLKTQNRDGASSKSRGTSTSGTSH